MLRKLTDEELREPGVVLCIPYEKWHRLPADVTDLLHYFIVGDTGSGYEVSLPAHLYRGIAQKLSHTLPESTGA